MRYFVVVNDGVILGVGKGGSAGREINEERYQAILDAVSQKPSATETTDYHLKEDLTWEPYEIDPPDPDPELPDEEALAILLGEGGTV